MPQSFANIAIHFVFSTKERAPWIRAEVASRLYAYVGGVIRDTKSGVLLAAGGMPDHVHLLVSMARDVSGSPGVYTPGYCLSPRWGSKHLGRDIPDQGFTPLAIMCRPVGAQNLGRCLPSWGSFI